MCPSYARVSRAVRRARASVTRRLPSNGRSRRLPPVNHSSHPSHPRALRRPMRVTHTSYSSLDPLLIHTHAPTIIVRTISMCPTDHASDRPNPRRHADATPRAVASQHIARRRRPSTTPAAHTTRTHTRVRILRARPRTHIAPPDVDSSGCSPPIAPADRQRTHPEVTAHAPRDRLRRRPYTRTSSIVFD